MDVVTRSDGSKVNLFAGEFPVISKAITLALGAGLLILGTILGLITKGAVTVAAPTVANTGNGTCTLDATTPKLANSVVGVYKVRVIRAAIAAVGTTPPVGAIKGLAELRDPFGRVLDIFEVPTAPGVTISNHVKFALVEGSTPFIVGDGFDITIAAPAAEQYKAYDPTATDGSEKAVMILGENADDATSVAVNTVGYKSGYFNKDALTGYDTNAGKNFAGTPIFIGTIL